MMEVNIMNPDQSETKMRYMNVFTALNVGVF